MIRKQWLVSVYDLGSHPLLRVGALSYQFQFSFMFDYLSVWLVSSVSYSPMTKCFQEEMKEHGLISTQAGQHLP